MGLIDLGPESRRCAVPYLLTKEVAERYRVSEATVRWWRHVGRGPAYFTPPGSARVLYDSAELDAYDRSCRSERRTGGTAA